MKNRGKVQCEVKERRRLERKGLSRRQDMRRDKEMRRIEKGGSEGAVKKET